MGFPGTARFDIVGTGRAYAHREGRDFLKIFPNVGSELAFCRDMYPGFSEIAEDIEDIVRALASDAARLQDDVPIPDDTSFDQDEADERFRLGKPLCPRVRVPRAVWESLVTTAAKGFSRMYPDQGEALTSLAEAMVRRAMDDGEESFALTDEKIDALLSVTPESDAIGPDVTTLFVTLALATAYRMHLHPDLHRLDTAKWGEAHCPICGQGAHYGMLDPDGVRLLECWLCAARWSFPRLCCPHCGLKDHEALGYFTIESLEMCPVYFCSHCSKYIKMFDLREYETEASNLMLHNLATLSCDLVASSEGFASTSKLCWTSMEEEQ